MTTARIKYEELPIPKKSDKKIELISFCMHIFEINRLSQIIALI